MLLSLLAVLLAMPLLLAQHKVILKGKIQKAVTKEIIIASLPSPLHPEEVQTIAKLEKGQFIVEIPLTEAGTVELVYGDESVPLYLEPGFDLYVSFTAGKMLKTLKYKGKGANENNYLALHTYRFDEEEDYQTLPDNVKLPEKGFIEFLEYRKEDQLSKFEKKTNSKPVSDQFRELILAEIDYSYANDRLTYYEMRERMKLYTGSGPSAAYFDFVESLDMEQPASQQCFSFPTFLRNYVAFATRQANIAPSDIHYFKKAYELVSRTLQGDARIMAQALLIRQSLQQGNVLHVQTMLQDFERTASNPAAYAALQKQYQNHPGLGIGSVAPEFSLNNIKGEQVSLSDFRGKVVYLSFWRTDCGLCMVEQPHAQELARKLKDHNVVMVQIGVDENEQTWRRVVESRGLSGIQLHLKGQSSVLAKEYGLKDIPAYFLIDETGSILSVKPRRPIDREAEKEILQHVMNNRASAR
jgi:peroxiredoxin